MTRAALIEAKQNPLVKKAAEVTAKRMRMARLELFRRITFAERSLRLMLDHYRGKITDAVLAKGHATKYARSVNDLIHQQTVTLRSGLRVWIHSAIRDAAKMGFRHIGDALLPVFKHNRESIEQTVLAERALFEGKLTFGLKTAFAANAVPTVSFADQKWQDAAAAIIGRITKGNLVGLNPSERIWELTRTTEADLKRIVTGGMADGENPRVIARKIARYISPAVTDASSLGVSVGPGVYRSPYANAMRLARTEMNKTYVASQVNFAKDKDWVTGMDITLSPIHAEDDECDELADGGPYTPDEVAELIPAHPHCMCHGTPIIDPKYLGEDQEAA